VYWQYKLLLLVMVLITLASCYPIGHPQQPDKFKEQVAAAFPKVSSNRTKPGKCIQNQQCSNGTGGTAWSMPWRMPI
jgi:hypothetical protein